MADETPAVENEPAESRLAARVDGQLAHLDYRRDGRRLFLLHTEVPHSLEGRGLGGRLVRAAVETAREGDLTIVPWCPFARRWLRDHPAETTGVQIDWTVPPP